MWRYSLPFDRIACQQVKRAIRFTYFLSTWRLERRDLTLKISGETLLLKLMCAQSLWLPLLMKSFLNCKGIKLLSCGKPLSYHLSTSYTWDMHDVHCSIFNALYIFPCRQWLAVDGGWYCLSNPNKNALVKQFRVSKAVLARYNPPFTPAKRFREVENSSL